MYLNIEFDNKYFKSDEIDNGRIACSFFEALATNIFNQSYKHWRLHKDITGVGQLPILFNERNIYSTIAAAIDKITPIHLSEWSFNPSDEADIEKSRRVDFWCLNKDGENGNPINYFMEIKKGGYNLNERSEVEFNKKIEVDITNTIEQIQIVKKLDPSWEDIDCIFIAINIIHGFYSKDQEHYDMDQVRENIHDLIDKRIHAQLAICNWTLPEDMDVQWDNHKCRFISIAGIIISYKSN